MNIVKFKDIVLTDADIEKYQLDTDQIELFNNKFKAKYTYCINWTYCVSFEDISIDQVLTVSRQPDLIDEYVYLLYDKIKDLIDIIETEKINSINKYKEFNTFTPDTDITVEELKRFRTWLAEKLLTLTDLDDDNKHVLEYYKNGMTDVVIKYLNVFGNTTLALETTSSTSSCGCNKTSQSVIASTVTSSSCGCNSGNLSSLYLQGISKCDPLFIYKKNIYLKMVEMFSNIDFWTSLPVEFIVEIKKYIDNIIKLNFDLVKYTFVIDYAECGCVSESQAAQTRQINRLNNLSTALSYIIGEIDIDEGTAGVTGHKQSINSALNEWATYLYEIMEW